MFGSSSKSSGNREPAVLFSSLRLRRDDQAPRGAVDREMKLSKGLVVPLLVEMTTFAKRWIGSWLATYGSSPLGTGCIPFTLFFLVVGYKLYDGASVLPVWPWVLGDSSSYLEFSEIRPHGYPLLLAVFQHTTGSLKYLPQFRFGLYDASLAALAVAVALRVGSALAAFPAFLLGEQVPALAFDGVMSDAIFASLLAFGAASFFLYRHRGKIIWLGAASLFVGAAATCRTIGYVPLACLWAWALFAFMALAPSQRWGLGSRTALLAIVPAALALSIAAGSNLYRHGDFRIGTWGGVSLLGKGLVLASPLPAADPMSRFNSLAEATSKARATLDEIEDPVLSMLVTRQYYEYLRWFIAWKMLPDLDNEWRAGDGVEMEKTARDLALAYVRQDPAGYLRLSLADYGALWLVPGVLTKPEAEILRDRYARLRDVVFLRAFAETAEGKSEYYSVIPKPHPALKVYAIRLGSFLFLTLSSGMLMYLLWTRRRATGKFLDLILVCLVVHLSYVAIALTEAGLERYVSGTWPLLCAAISAIVFQGSEFAWRKALRLARSFWSSTKP
jgi:hypothetical protein